MPILIRAVLTRISYGLWGGRCSGRQRKRRRVGRSWSKGVDMIKIHVDIYKILKEKLKSSILKIYIRKDPF